MPARDLAIAIPARNAPGDLAALLAQVAELDLFAQVVISDDASDPPLDPDPAGLGAPLDLVRAEDRGGAGAARNRALHAVRTRDVLFFDADDRLEPALAGVADAHAASEADFTIFRHADSRVAGPPGGFAVDEALWDAALGTRAEASLTRARAASLAKVANYPWNKIYRTDFLRSNGLRCSETPVHNDILLHWGGFLRARSILASRAIGARHVVRARTGHLTRSVGPERLCLHDALSDVLPVLRGAEDRALFTAHFVEFAHSVIRWNLSMLRGEVRRAFADAARAWLHGLRPPEFAAYAAARPGAAMRLAGFAAGEPAP